MSVLGISLIIILLFSIPCIALLCYVVYIIIKNTTSNKINGVQVEGIIKDVKRINERDQKNGAIYDNHIELEIEFEYEGKEQTLTQNVFNVLDESKYKVGDKVVCIYNTKTNEIVPSMNLKTKENRRFWFACLSAIVMIVFAIFFYREDSTITHVILAILGIIFWYAATFVFYDNYYIKDKKNYVKLKGHVIEYHVRYDIDNKGIAWDYYCPEISFKYNNEKKKYLSSRLSTKKLFHIGQEVDVYYNPETDRIYEKGNNTYVMIFMIVPPILGIIMLIQYLLK